MRIFFFVVFIMSMIAGCSSSNKKEDSGVYDSYGQDSSIVDSFDDITDISNIDAAALDAELVDTTPQLDMIGNDMICPDNGPMVPVAWVTLMPGTFTMGSPKNELCRESDETQHQVTLTHAFDISIHETTQAQFKQLMGSNPSQFTSCDNGNRPVDSLSWYQAAAYCNMLSVSRGLTQCYNCSGGSACQLEPAYSGENIYKCPGFRLCTEAEWEYAYRAGMGSAYYNGGNASCTSIDSNADKIGWYTENAASSSHPVGQKAPNAWGLYDMAGNVWEWCQDLYEENLGSTAVSDPWGSATGGYRIYRGGSWYSEAGHLRASYRNYNVPTLNLSYVGVRCCRTTN